MHVEALGDKALIREGQGFGLEHQFASFGNEAWQSWSSAFDNFDSWAWSSRMQHGQSIQIPVPGSHRASCPGRTSTLFVQQLASCSAMIPAKPHDMLEILV